MRGCEVAILSAVCSYGSLHGAYLPWAGPAPLRFKSAPVLPVKAKKLIVLPITSISSSPATTADDGKPSALVLEIASLGPTPWDQAAEEIWSGDAEIPISKPAQPDEFTIPSEQAVIVTPQSLIPFFAKPGGDANVPASAPVEFMPPLRVPSSTAVYIKE